MNWLKKSTAATIKLGPFIDDTDGKTAETGLTISQADIRLSKNGGDIAQSNNATGATHDELGYYDIPLDTTDTNTVGRLRVAVHESGALPVWADFMVLPADVYDSLIAGTDKLPVQVEEWRTGSGTSAPVIAFESAGVAHPSVNVQEVEEETAGTQIQALAAAALTAYDPPTNAEMEARTLVAADYVVVGDTIAGVTTVTTTTSVTNGVTLADDAITAAKFDESTAFPLKSADTGATAVARTGADSDTLETLSDEIAAAKAVADAIEVDTQDLQTQVGTDGAGLTALPWSAAWDAEVQSEVADALAVYDPPTNAEMEARTIAAANYATAAALDAVDNYVDTEVAAIKAVTDKLDTAVELDGAVYRLTTNALEQAPSPEVTLSPEDIAAIAAGITIDPQDIRDAMKLAPTAGAAATGSVDAHLDAIELKTSTIGSVTVTAVSPIVAGDELDIVSGGDHTSTRAFTFTYTGHDLTTAGTTARLRLITAASYGMGTETSVLQVAGTITPTNTSSGSIAVSMTAAQSDVLLGSVHPRNYRYQLQIVPLSGDPWLLAQGWANVSLFHSAVPA